MQPAASSLIERRRDQVFPILSPHEVDRLRRFGTVRSFADGEPLVAPARPATA